MDATRKRSETPVVVVGVGGGIAAYKIGYLVRFFRKNGWEVHVLPTASALRFVGEPTWRELSENPVTTDVFSAVGPGHVHLAGAADLIVVAPATANLVAKLRAGIADDMLTTTIAASAAPLVLAPAMHTQMWESGATQENIQVLKDRGAHVIEPETGSLSSGNEGPGRLPDPVAIGEEALRVWESDKVRMGRLHTVDDLDLSGRHVVITAGGTQEPIDPVRYVGNRSSGKQGVALVNAALARGADVTLIRAAMSAQVPTDPRLTVISALTAEEMAKSVAQVLTDADALIMAAAVADFTPESVSEDKIKKTPTTEQLELRLRRTQDILASVAASPDRPQALVGFGAETGSRSRVELLGSQKAQAKGCDLLAVNQVGHDVGFGDVPNTLIYFNDAGQIVGETSGSKDQVAADLISRVVAHLRKKDQQ